MDEIEDLKRQLAESQAREAELKGLLNAALSHADHHKSCDLVWNQGGHGSCCDCGLLDTLSVCNSALALPADDTALQQLLREAKDQTWEKAIAVADRQELQCGQFAHCGALKVSRDLRAALRSETT